MATNSFDKSLFLADQTPPVCSLAITQSFSSLTEKEKLYAHHLSQGCWNGARIIMNQTTLQSESLFDFIITLFSTLKGGKMTNMVEFKLKSGLNDQDWEDCLSYSAQVLSNLSNIKSFGSKFIPRAPVSAFLSLIKNCENPTLAQKYYSEIESDLYSLDIESKLSIGKPSEGHISAYYPSDPAPSESEINEVQRMLDGVGISVLNTRLSSTSPGQLKLHIASSSKTLPSSYPTTLTSSTTPPFTLTLTAGDFSDSLSKISDSLLEATKYTANSNQSEMLIEYKNSFESGNIENHKKGSSKWVKDIGPVVESYIGFIESYVDPYGGRAEFEGFVAIVNKEESVKFGAVAAIGGDLVKELPWGPDFEVKQFITPDFTALEIVAFSTGGIPAGINIPNYYDVREKDGYKNVSLSNILSAKVPGEIPSFIHPDEVDSYELWESKAFAMQVCSHELVGHGSGIQFTEDSDGNLNFDKEKVRNPLNGEKIESWYKPGETYGSKMGSISSSMEECRAEAVALYLASNQTILNLFGHTTKEDQENLIYFTFVLMARAGLRALEFYDEKTGKHGQAHMEARLGITNWLLTHNLLSLSYIYSPTNPTELINVYVNIDKAAVLSRGKEVMGKLLVEIQVRKSTGDAKGAEEFYKPLTTPSTQFITEIKPLVLSQRLPRKIFVQPNTILNKETGKVELKEYGVNFEGVLESFIERGL